MLDLWRESFSFLEKRVGKVFSIFPLKPNHWTLLSIFFALFYLLFLWKGKLNFALFSFFVSSFLDFVDGAVAREKGLATKKGAYLDTISDRYVEAIFLLGFFFLPLPKIIFPSFIWIFLVLFGSIMTTYVKAAAKEKELTKKELKGGLISRGERIILIFLSLIFFKFNPIFTSQLLILIAILTNLTALQRIFLAFKQTL